MYIYDTFSRINQAQCINLLSYFSTKLPAFLLTDVNSYLAVLGKNCFFISRPKISHGVKIVHTVRKMQAAICAKVKSKFIPKMQKSRLKTDVNCPTLCGQHKKESLVGKIEF